MPSGIILHHFAKESAYRDERLRAGRRNPGANLWDARRKHMEVEFYYRGRESRALRAGDPEVPGFSCNSSCLYVFTAVNIR